MDNLEKKSSWGVSLSPLERKLKRSFFQTFPQGELFLVGGRVRDLLLQKESHDTDLLVAGVQKRDLERWLMLFGKTVFAGIFGVFHVSIGKQVLEVALPRTEKAYKNNRGKRGGFHVNWDASLPLSEDLKRRDFTMNAMALNLRTEELIDPFQGKRDLQKRTLRAVGDPKKRFNEDHSRLFRGIRFACTLDLIIEKKTWSALRQMQRQLKPDSVSRDILGKELTQALSASPALALTLLYKSGILNTLAPQINRPAERLSRTLRGIPSKKHEGIPLPSLLGLLTTFLPASSLQPTLSTLGLLSLPRTHPLRISLPLVKTIAKGLAIRPQDIQTLELAELEALFPLKQDAWWREKWFVRTHPPLAKEVRKRIRMLYRKTGTPFRESLPPLVAGKDLRRAAIPEGPRIRELLLEIRGEQLMGRVKTKKQAFSLVFSC